jgi:hypothetical protein
VQQPAHQHKAAASQHLRQAKQLHRHLRVLLVLPLSCALCLSTLQQRQHPQRPGVQLMLLPALA